MNEIVSSEKFAASVHCWNLAHGQCSGDYAKGCQCECHALKAQSITLREERDQARASADAWRQTLRLWMKDILQEEVPADIDEWPLKRVGERLKELRLYAGDECARCKCAVIRNPQRRPVLCVDCYPLWSEEDESPEEPSMSEPEITPTTAPAITIDHIVEHVLRDVAELPDRTSPEDWPEAMIVTDKELERIVVEHVAPAFALPLLASDEINGLHRVVAAFEQQREDAIELLKPEERERLFAKWRNESTPDDAVFLGLRFYADRVVTTRRPSATAPFIAATVAMNADNQGELVVSVRDPQSDDPDAVGYVLVIQKWAKEWPRPTNSATLKCEMCDAPAICLALPEHPGESARFSCGECCGCAQCSTVHDAENPFCEAETTGCYRLVGVSAYVTKLLDDLHSLDETTSGRINELEEKFKNTEALTNFWKRVAGAFGVKEETFQRDGVDAEELLSMLASVVKVLDLAERPREADAVRFLVKTYASDEASPIPLILHCPSCHLQHVDVDDDSGKWASTRIHRKHLCKPEDGGCGNIWAPSNRYTVGVKELPEEGR